MYIKKLVLQNFRKFNLLNLSFENMHLAITGDNTCGKTTILEAIRLLSIGRSFRKSSNLDMIYKGAALSLISVEFKNNIDSFTHSISCSFSKDKKTFSYDGDILQNLSSLLGILPTIVFEPQSAYFFKDIPSIRRKFLDEVFSLISHDYLYELKRYKLLLKQRNTSILLRNDPEIVNLLKDQMIEKSFLIVQTRKTMIEKLSKKTNEIYKKLMGNETTNIALTYSTNCSLNENKEKYKEEMNDIFSQQMSREALQKGTFIGPHKDDLICKLSNNFISVFGSQGENRIASLSLRLAVSELINESIKEMPILLLDDVTSDLDSKREENLFSYLTKEKQQVFITTNITKQIDKYTSIDINNMEASR